VSENWSPLRELSEVRSRLERALREAGRWSVAGPARVGAPPLDFSEACDAFLVRVAVPGATKGDLRVAVQEGALEIAGQLPERSAPGVEVVRAERFRGPFRRVVPLPREADLAGVTASLAEGVLTVRVPRHLPGGRRTVEIE